MDVAPELYEAINEEIGRLDQPKRENIRKKIDAKTAGHTDTHKYALSLGKTSSRALQDNLTEETLPDGRLYYNIANRTVKPVLQDNYEKINQIASDVQAVIDEKDGIHLASTFGEYPEDLIDGLINKMCDDEDFTKWLGEPVVNFTEKIFDAFIKANAAARYEAGMGPVIVRTATGNPCKWCRDLAGTYEYTAEINPDVFRRHENCRCSVIYKNGRQRQDVWSKEIWEEKIELPKQAKY